MIIVIAGIDNSKSGTIGSSCIARLIGKSSRKIDGVLFCSTARNLDELESEISVIPTDIREIGCVGIISRGAEFHIQISLETCWKDRAYRPENENGNENRRKNFTHKIH
ncbi:MAG: hypothetical protein ACD_78C00268G0001 [uncultured bacterium (gcode 4)]|uniref:Uncharacterized protein n=1 Tax=uncultured bacterium (gcode 4) TaxID=1234023 RepID=K1YBU7_9BACT|nr:MAG: hypothetical protein ACD_78C00268G0001 [uncultured bacterium (gcode 4)]